MVLLRAVVAEGGIEIKASVELGEFSRGCTHAEINFTAQLLLTSLRVCVVVVFCEF